MAPRQNWGWWTPPVFFFATLIGISVPSIRNGGLLGDGKMIIAKRPMVESRRSMGQLWRERGFRGGMEKMVARATLKSLQERRQGIKKIHKITSAIKFVAVSRLAGAKRSMKDNQPFSEHVQGTLRGLLQIANKSGEGFDSQLLRPQAETVHNVTILIIGSNKGLCGPFNSEIVARAKMRIQELESMNSGVKVDVICVGKRLRKSTRRQGLETTKIFSLPPRPEADDAAEVMDRIVTDFEAGYTERVEVIYTSFSSPAKQQPRIRTLLPVNPTGIETDQDETLELKLRKGTILATKGTMPPAPERRISDTVILDPDLNTIIEMTSRLYVESQMLRMMLESVVCEQLAARQAMQKATDSAEDLHRKVSGEYQRKRQSAITQEILQIVGGVVEQAIQDPQNTASTKYGQVPPAPNSQREFD
ncbi:hypothetical protein AAMO2058_000034500 [Amorphochlora amoebiformis]